MRSSGYFIASSDGRKLYFRYWPSSANRLCICFLHGLGLHSECFEEAANFFVEKGISVTAIDFRGHGKSEGTRGHATIDQLVADAETLILETEKHFMHSIKVLFGQQAGATVAFQQYLSGKQKVQGLIFCPPFFKPFVEVGKRKTTLLALLSLLFPVYTFENPYPCTNFTNIEAIHHQLSARLWFDLLRYGKKQAKIGYRVNVPLLVIHGTSDKISQYKASVAFSRNTGMFTTFKAWEGASHFLLDDNTRFEILEYIYNWISEKILCK